MKKISVLFFEFYRMFMFWNVNTEIDIAYLLIDLLNYFCQFFGQNKSKFKQIFSRNKKIEVRICKKNTTVDRKP